MCVTFRVQKRLCPFPHNVLDVRDYIELELDVVLLGIITLVDILRIHEQQSVLLASL